MLRFLVLVALASDAIASAGVFKDGPCPPVKTKANFDFSLVSVNNFTPKSLRPGPTGFV